MYYFTQASQTSKAYFHPLSLNTHFRTRKITQNVARDQMYISAKFQKKIEFVLME